jgi:hypothetical protein
LGNCSQKALARCKSQLQSRFEDIATMSFLTEENTMASVHIARWVDMNFMFNISAGVGKSRPNRRLDVMLVQYLLRLAQNVAKTASGSTTSPIVPPDLAGELFKADGICGPKTLRYIEYYQQFRNSHNQRSDKNNLDVKFKVATDGAIDPWVYPAHVGMSFGGASQPVDSTRTLIALCYDAAKHPEAIAETYTEMPQELRKLLMAR